MKVTDAIKLLDATVVWGDELVPTTNIEHACGSDMMSDVLAYVKDQSVLLTGLVNSQVIRTAEMMDVVCIIFVRGKIPDEDMISIAKQRNIILLSTAHRMFMACGLLYSNGLEGGTSHDYGTDKA